MKAECEDLGCLGTFMLLKKKRMEMSASIGPLIFHKVYLLFFSPAFSSNGSGKLHKEIHVFLALHHLLTPLGFVFSHVLSCVPKTEHVLLFFHYINTVPVVYNAILAVF